MNTETFLYFLAGFFSFMIVLAFLEWRGAVRERRRLDGLRKRRPATGIPINGEMEGGWDFDDQDRNPGRPEP